MAVTRTSGHIGARTLLDLCRHRALVDGGDSPAYTFMEEREAETDSLTYSQLDRRARALAVALRESAQPGDRALLLFLPGLDFTTAFFGCLYAGVIAVPCMPPYLGSPEQLSRLEAITRSAQPAAIVSHSAALTTLAGGQLPRVPLVLTDRVDSGLGELWEEPRIGPGSVAYLQYSSGSTAMPKGVVLTHRSVLHQLTVIHDALGITSQDTTVSWLPTFHDMGLIASTVQPLYERAPSHMMSPLSFMQRPVSWLAAVTKHHATISAGPDFAYELCVRRIAPEQRASLDLSAWRVAISGAESVRRDTLDAFVAAFGPCGFRRESFVPSYGLAEATLMVTGGPWGQVPRTVDVDQEALGRNRVAIASETDGPVRTLVGCGRPGPALEVLIVDPHTLRTRPADEVGEIWVAGPSVGLGYWMQPDESARSFGVRGAGSDTGYLRTGDLGFLLDGEPFVTGRLKDLIIISGQNHYPEDLEMTVQRIDPRIGRCAAFPVEFENREHLVIAGELRRAARPAASKGSPDERPLDGEGLLRTVRLAVARQHGLHVHDVVLVGHGTLPLTSSGKIQRHACRALYAAGGLKP
jgi:acyl-CoA synthetase (AMP-forming)/AMP-acid ligase II